MPAASSLRRFALAQCPPEPWRNGGGSTRTLASQMLPESAQWRWRVSLATIEQNGPFSCFDGVDRISLLLAGQQLQLSDDSGCVLHRLGLHESAAYPGELALQAQIQGGPLACLNVMTRRGAAQARLTLASQPVRLTATQSIALVLHGAWHLRGDAGAAPARLDTGEGVQATPAAGAALQPAADGSSLALIEISYAAPSSHFAP